MSTQAELHLLNQRIALIEDKVSDIDAGIPRAELKLREKLIVASFQKMVLYVSQSPEHDEYMQSVCECAVRWADMMIKVKK